MNSGDRDGYNVLSIGLFPQKQQRDATKLKGWPQILAFFVRAGLISLIVQTMNLAVQPRAARRLAKDVTSKREFGTVRSTNHYSTILAIIDLFQLLSE